MKKTKDDQSGRLTRMRLSLLNRPFEAIRHWRDEGTLLLDPPYQRGHVWGTERRVNLIRSVLLGIPIPAIVINDRMEAGWPEGQWKYAVIDGKQRCTTILMFMDGELAIPGEWIGMSGEVTFDDFAVADQRRFRQWATPFCEGVLPTIEQEIEVFELLNHGGVPQGECDDEGRN